MFCREQGLPFVGKIPFDPQAVKAINAGASVVETDCPAGNAIRAMYPRLLELLAAEVPRRR